jgi:hypothetical protein
MFESSKKGKRLVYECLPAGKGWEIRYCTVTTKNNLNAAIRRVQPDVVVTLGEHQKAIACESDWTGAMFCAPDLSRATNELLNKVRVMLRWWRLLRDHPKAVILGDDVERLRDSPRLAIRQEGVEEL